MTGLPLDWHDDGTPIFLRGDFIREPVPLPPQLSRDAVMYHEIMLPEHKHLRPEIRYNMMVLVGSQGELANQAWLGKSKPDEKRGFVFGRVLQALDANCRVILQRSSAPGRVSDFVLFSLHPLQFVVVPPVYEALLLNASKDLPARFFKLQAREEERNIEDLEALLGPGYLLKSDNQLEANKNYDELSIPRIQPGLVSFRFMGRKPLYELLTRVPGYFDFMDPPREGFFAGAV